MAISWSAAGSVTSGSGASPTLNPGSPASDANSFNFLVIGWKGSAVAEPSVSSVTGVWIRLGFADSSVDVASGADVGSTSTLVYYAKGTCPGTTSVVFTGTVGLASAVIANTSKSSSESYVFSYSTGSDESFGANYSVTTTTNFLATANDLLIACMANNTDGGTISAQAITATGLTMGATTNRVSSRSAVADDLTLQVDSAPVTSGTQSAAAVHAHTNASSSQGTSLIIRLRVLANPTISILAIAPFAQTAGYRITASGLSSYAQFKVTATESSVTRDLRGAEQQNVSASSFVGEDYEFNFGTTAAYASQNITYTVTVYSEGQTVATVSAVTSQTPYAEWLASLASSGFTTGQGPKSYLGVPRTPALNIPILIAEFDTYSRDGRLLSKSNVLRRANPVVSVDVTSGKQGTMSILVPQLYMGSSQYVPTNIMEHINVLDGGHIFLLRNLSPYVAAVDDFYFVVDSFSVKRLNRFADMTSSDSVPTVTIEVTWTEVDAPPATDEVSVLSWQDILDNYPSWQAVLDANINWLDVLQNG